MQSIKRKLSEDQDFSVAAKMMRFNASANNVLENMDNTDDTIEVQGDRFMLNFKLTEKTAKANLLKSSNRKQLEIDTKQTCMNMKFSPGAYLQCVLPVIKKWGLCFQSKQTINEENIDIRVEEFEERKEMSAKHVNTKLVLFVNGDKIVVHCYNSTQNLRVDGKKHADFVGKYLKPKFLQCIEKHLHEITQFDRALISSLNPKNTPLRASRSVKNIRSVIHQSSFKCKKCDFTCKTFAQLRRHKVSIHSKSFDTSDNSMLPIIHSTRNNSFNDERLLCEDISIEKIDEFDAFEKDTIGNKSTSDEENSSIIALQYPVTTHTNEDAKQINNNDNASKDTTADENAQTEEKCCRKCNFKTISLYDLDKHMEETHGNQSKSLTITIQENLQVDMSGEKNVDKVDLIEDLNEHQSKHTGTIKIKCTKCKFSSDKEDIVKQHEILEHITVRVDVHCTENNKTGALFCEECDYTCRLNIN